MASGKVRRQLRTQQVRIAAGQEQIPSGPVQPVDEKLPLGKVLDLIKKETLRVPVKGVEREHQLVVVFQTDELGNWVTRKAMAGLVTQALEWNGKGAAPALARFLTQTAARFGVVVSEKLAAQAAPLISASAARSITCPSSYGTRTSPGADREGIPPIQQNRAGLCSLAVMASWER